MDELDVKQPYVAQKTGECKVSRSWPRVGIRCGMELTHHLSGAPEAAVLRYQILMDLFNREGLSGVLLQLLPERPGGQGLRKNSCL